MEAFKATASLAPTVEAELQEILRSLSEKIRAESAGSVGLVRRRARLAEVGVVRTLCALCARYLGADEDGGAPGPSFMTPGQIRDALDGALLDARELMLLRDEAEATLQDLSPSALRLEADSHALLSRLIEQESFDFSRIQARETLEAEQAALALRTCLSDVTKVLMDALVCAADGDLSNEARRSIALKSASRIEGAAGAWTSWFVAFEKNTSEGVSSVLPSTVVDRALSARMAADATLHSLVVAFRHAMRLRRRHARMAAAIARLRAAVVGCDALSALAGSVAEP